MVGMQTVVEAAIVIAETLGEHQEEKRKDFSVDRCEIEARA